MNKDKKKSANETQRSVKNHSPSKKNNNNESKLSLYFKNPMHNLEVVWQSSCWRLEYD